MNWYIISGLIIIAIGTGLLTYGGVWQSRKDAAPSNEASMEKLDQITRDVSELKGRPKSELSARAIEHVEGDIEEWVRQFGTDSDVRKLALNQRSHEAQTSAEAGCALGRDYFAYCVSLIRAALPEYKASTSKEFDWELPEVPEKLFIDPSLRYDGVVNFSATEQWQIEAFCNSAFPDISSTMVSVFLREKSKESQWKRVGQLRLIFYAAENSKNYSLVLTGAWRGLYSPSEFTEPTSKYEKTINAIVRNMIESQLIK